MKCNYATLCLHAHGILNSGAIVDRDITATISEQRSDLWVVFFLQNKSVDPLGNKSWPCLFKAFKLLMVGMLKGAVCLLCVDRDKATCSRISIFFKKHKRVFKEYFDISVNTIHFLADMKLQPAAR